MKKIDISELNINPYTAIGENWMLITAGCNKDNYNTMTASWGHIGSIWGHGSGRPTACVYIRPIRYTKRFVDKNEYFSLCFFNEEFKNDLLFLGTHSGADENKVAHTKLDPVEDPRAVYFKQADIVLICRKIYRQELKEECFVDKELIPENYPTKDFHTMYIGEIVEILKKEED